jgi:hypothetical protein
VVIFQMVRGGKAMAGNGYIQVQVNFFGNWRTVSHVTNNSQLITNSMMNAQKGHPSKRIRAVDSEGRLVDML